jgi:rubredoxin
MEPFTSALAGLRVAIDGLKGAAETLDKAKIEGAIAEVRAALLSTQEIALRLQEDAASHYKDKAALEKQITDLSADLRKAKEWSEKASCYDLVRLFPQSLTYVREFNPEKGKALGINEPAHWICPICYEEGKRVILRQVSPTSSRMKCSKCDFEAAAEQPRPHQPYRSPQPNYGVDYGDSMT